jgi:hypothetical protein
MTSLPGSADRSILKTLACFDPTNTSGGTPPVPVARIATVFDGSAGLFRELSPLFG